MQTQHKYFQQPEPETSFEEKYGILEPSFCLLFIIFWVEWKWQESRKLIMAEGALKKRGLNCVPTDGK